MSENYQEEFLKSGSAKIHAEQEHQKIVDKNANLAVQGCEFTDVIQANGKQRVASVKVKFKNGVMADSEMLIPAHMVLYDKDETYRFVRKHIAQSMQGEETYLINGFDEFNRAMTGYAARAILRDLVKRYESDNASVNPVYLDDLIETINKVTVKKVTKS